MRVATTASPRVPRSCRIQGSSCLPEAGEAELSEVQQSLAQPSGAGLAQPSVAKLSKAQLEEKAVEVAAFSIDQAHAEELFVPNLPQADTFIRGAAS